MREIHSISDVVKRNLCIGCGLCTIDPMIHTMKYSKKNDCMAPASTNLSIDSLAHFICPGKGYDIKGMAETMFSSDANYHMQLGFIDSLYAAHSLNFEILANASSGGIITQILLYLIEQGIVDSVSVTQFYCDVYGVHTRTFLTNERDEIMKAQGSKYCPVCYDQLIKEMHEREGRVAIVATPCVIAGIRAIENKNPGYLKTKVIFYIANFCGGFKSFRNIKRLADIHKVDYYKLSTFRFRGGGQPGSLKFVEKSGKVASTPYPQYVGLNGYSKMLRCHLCPDATGELADISCGDAWIPRFQRDVNTWSMVVCRNKKASDLILQIQKDGFIVTDEVSIEEVQMSQRHNLKSKKDRQYARMKLYGILGYAIPSYAGKGYSLEMSSIKTEIIVFIKHKLTLWAEKLGLYMVLYGKKKL